MRRTILALVTACIALTFAGAAPAQLATIEATATDIGGGLIAWDVFLTDAGPPAGGAVDLKFEGAIHQVPLGPTTTNSPMPVPNYDGVRGVAGSNPAVPTSVS